MARIRMGKGDGTMLKSLIPARPTALAESRIAMMSSWSALRRALWVSVFLLVSSLGIGGLATAQESFGGADIFPDFSLGGFGDQGDGPATWSARYSIDATGKGRIEVEVSLAPTWHIYSLTQLPGGPLKTKLSVTSPSAVKVTSAFTPAKPPSKHISKVYDGLSVEEHDGVVIWSAPFTATAGFSEPITVTADGLVCKTDGACIPVRETLTATASDTISQAPTGTPPSADSGSVKQVAADSGSVVAAVAEKITPFRDGNYVVEWVGSVVPNRLQRGGRGAIKFTAKPDATFHVYRAAIDDAESSTNFVVTKKNGLKVGAPKTNNPVISHTLAPSLPDVHFHKGAVTWELPIVVPADATTGVHTVEGMVVYQACTDSSCHRPMAFAFSAKVTIGPAAGAAVSGSVQIKPTKRNDALDAAETTKWVDKIAPEATGAETAGPAQLNPGQLQPGDPKVGLDSRGPSPHSTGGPSQHAAAGGGPSALRTGAGTGTGQTIVQDSPEEIAAMALLYDANKKIRYLVYSDMAANPVGSGGASSSDQTTFWSALFGAFVGGMFLNLMPCVFPVLGLKVMGFVEQAGSDPRKIRLHGVAFASGLVVSMWVLAGLILSVKLVLGQDINWGAQMGNPYFVCAMIVLLFVLGLNMAGVFEFGSSMTRVGGNLRGKKGYLSSFLSGVLTTLIATPCSGPFLGAAMSYTLAQTAGTAMFLFTVFAMGIATPYLLLCFFPALINKLPRPGVWMETFKVTMAFALFATVAFFMQAFGGQTGASGLSWLAMALVVIGLAAYYHGTWSAPHIKRLKRALLGYALPAAIAGIGVWMCFGAASERVAPTSAHRTGGLAWHSWNPGKIEYSLTRDKRPIWVDYTAHW